MGRYENAANYYAEVLSENETLLNVQIEAASSFQSGGDRGNADMYRKAIVGDHRHPTTKKPVIWGWARLGNVAARQMAGGPEKKAQFGKYFYQARLNVAQCRFGQARLSSGEQRDELMRKARLDIVRIAKLYPDLGGDARRSEFDALLREIQEALGEVPLGLSQRSER